MDEAGGVPAHLVSTLLVYARHADQDGRGTHPGCSAVARQTRKSRAQAKKDTAELEGLGLLVPGDQDLVKDIRAGRRPKVYDLAMPRGAPASPARAPRGAPASPARGSSGTVTGLIQSTDGAHSYEPMNTLNKPRTAARAREATSRPHNRDPRLVLLGLDETVTDAEAETIAAALEADPDVRDPFAYLLAISAAGPQQIGEFLDRMRRQLAADEPSAERPAKPPWCGECDEETRLAELPDGGMTRCIRCHPLAQTRPAAPEPPCDQPGCDGHGWIETGDGTVRRCPSHGRARQTRQHANNSPDNPRAARLADDLRDLVRGLDGDHKLTDAEVESIVAHDMTDARFRDDPLASIYDAVIDWNERNPAEGTP
jgi:hypothetical protein